MKKNREKDKTACYAKRCNTCEEDCELKDCGKSAIHDAKEDAWRRRGLRAKCDIPTVTFNDRMADGLAQAQSPYATRDEQNVYHIAKADAIRELVFFYLENPVQFDVLVQKFYFEKTQTQLAREEGVTRAAISKRIKEEQHSRLKREIAQLKEQNSFFLSLTGRELEVYQLLFVDGCTERATAMQLNISKSTVHRLGQNLRRKLNASGARKRGAS